MSKISSMLLNTIINSQDYKNFVLNSLGIYLVFIVIDHMGECNKTTEM